MIHVVHNFISSCLRRRDLHLILTNCQETERHSGDDDARGEASEAGDRFDEEHTRPKQPLRMKRRGAVSASVISEAEATSYVKKVKDIKLYNDIYELVTILQAIKNTVSNFLIAFLLKFLGCPEGL